jgi:hypothetical protein
MFQINLLLGASAIGFECQLENGPGRPRRSARRPASWGGLRIGIIGDEALVEEAGDTMVGRWERVAVVEGVVCNGCTLNGKLLRTRAFL